MPPVAAVFASVAASFSLSTFVTSIATSLVITVASRLIFKPDVPQGPTLEAQTRFVQEPNSPRQVCYGDAILAPKIVHSWNSRARFNLYHSGDTPNCYNLFCAVADHRVELRDMRADGIGIFSNNELRRIADDKVTALKAYDNLGAFPVTEDNPKGVIPTKRKEKNRLSRDFSGGLQFTPDLPIMMVWPKLSGKVDAQAGPEYYVRELQDPTIRDFSKQSSSAVFHNAQFLHAQTFGGTDVLPQYEYLSNTRHYGTWLEHDMHAFGTSTVVITLPIVTDTQKVQLWPSPPNILMSVRRPRDTLKLWDPTIRGNPEIDSAWAYNNAALCCYDYLVRYTDYGVPVSGVSRIDLDSVALAARQCHNAGWYYPLQSNEEPSVTEGRESTTTRRAVWKHEYSLTCNGSFDLASGSNQVLQQMVYALGGGYLAERAGIMYIHAGHQDAPVLGYDEDEIIENSWNINPVPDKPNRASVIDVSYNDINGKRQNVAFQHALAENNLKVTSVEMAFINNEAAARRIAFVLNSRAWETETISFKLLPDTPLPNINDRITLRLDELGVAGIYRVIEITENAADGTAELAVTSERPDLYNLPQIGDFVPAPAPPIRSDDGSEDNNLIVNPATGDLLTINAAGDLLIVS